MIDISNKYYVMGNSYGIIVGRMLMGAVSPDDALNLAAWLVTVAETQTKTKFEEVLEAVRKDGKSSV